MFFGKKRSPKTNANTNECRQQAGFIKQVLLDGDELLPVKDSALYSLSVGIKNSCPAVEWVIGCRGEISHAEMFPGSRIIPENLLRILTRETFIDWLKKEIASDRELLGLIDWEKLYNSAELKAWCDQIRSNG